MPVTRRGDYPALKQRGAFEATGKIPRGARDDRIHYDVMQLTVVSKQLQSLHAAAFPLQGGAPACQAAIFGWYSAAAAAMARDAGSLSRALVAS
jgi:hypothetical protein